MRTTLNIESDVLEAAREIARKEKTTAGAVISRLAREGLNPAQSTVTRTKLKNGVPVFPATGRVVTLEHVRRLMDEEGI